jgi:hypothetical protein
VYCNAPIWGIYRRCVRLNGLPNAGASYPRSTELPKLAVFGSSLSGIGGPQNVLWSRGCCVSPSEGRIAQCLTNFLALLIGSVSVASIGAGLGVGYEAGGSIGLILGALTGLVGSSVLLFRKRTEK